MIIASEDSTAQAWKHLSSNNRKQVPKKRPKLSTLRNSEERKPTVEEAAFQTRNIWI